MNCPISLICLYLSLVSLLAPLSTSASSTATRFFGFPPVCNCKALANTNALDIILSLKNAGRRKRGDHLKNICKIHDISKEEKFDL
jgi:thiamine biosynthesis lipoprotein ApbE